MDKLFLVELAVNIGFKLLKKHANSFVGSFILSGPLGFILGFFAKKFLGFMVEKAILQIDLGVIGAKVAMEQKEYEEFAKKAYERATKKVYTEEEKQEIRQAYVDAIHRFGTIGSGLRQH